MTFDDESDERERETVQTCKKKWLKVMKRSTLRLVPNLFEQASMLNLVPELFVQLCYSPHHDF